MSSSHAEPLPVVLEQKLFKQIAQTKEHSGSAPSREWNPQRFADDQLRGLVQRVFLPEQPEGCRQVVFSAVDASTEIREICLEVGRMVGELTGKDVCIADAVGDVSERDEPYGRNTCDPMLNLGVSGTLRDSSRQLAGRMWLLPSEEFWSGRDIASADFPQRRLKQLRSEFDYSVIQAPAAGVSGIAGLLGRFSDGLILILEAQSTRRLAAQRAYANLQGANARLLGSVLSERTFPIPEKLYRRL
jgi:hypothetical protein